MGTGHKALCMDLR